LVKIAALALFAFLIPCRAGADDVSAFLDRTVPPLMERNHVPGAVVVFVKDGEIVAARGYGVSELDGKTPVDPEKTMFRVGSISKVFVATAVLQLAEQGRLDLHRDVNSYLKTVRVPATFDKPITAADLLTHTSGFDERYHGFSAQTDPGPGDLEAFLREKMPARILPPGEVFTYSNYGYALAGYLVETISGRPFEQYVEENILAPLGMTHSSFRPTGAMLRALAQGYDMAGGGARPVPYDYLRDAPAGMLAASGADMGRFLIAQLESETGRQLHPVQFTHRAGLLNGYTYAFPVTMQRGRTALNHGGSYMGAIAQMWVVPEDRAGFFVAANVMSGAFTAEVSEAIWKEYFPERGGASPPPATPRAIADANLARFAGTYRMTRYAHSTFEKMDILGGLNAAELKITQAPDGTLLMPDLFGKPQRMIQIEKDLFQRADADYRIAFRESPTGKVTHLFTTGIDAFEKVPWYGERDLHRFLTVFFLVTFVSVLVNWMVRRRRSGPAPDALRRVLAAERWMSAVNLAYVLGLVFVMMVLVPRHELLAGIPYGLPQAIYVVQTIPYLSLALAGLLLWLNAGLWKPAAAGWGSRLYHLGIALCGVGFVVFLSYWNHIGYAF
jgi:CubicO group peptidase (beta-lactamase class C family)